MFIDIGENGGVIGMEIINASTRVGRIHSAKSQYGFKKQRFKFIQPGDVGSS